MNNNQLFYILLAVGLAIGLGVYFLTKDTVNWRVTYDIESEEPYGLYHSHRWISENWDKNKQSDFVESDLENILTSNKIDSVYTIVGYGWEIDDEEAELFLKHLAAGNDALLALEILPKSLNHALENHLNLTDDSLSYYDPVFLDIFYQDTVFFSNTGSLDTAFWFGSKTGPMSKDYHTITLRDDIRSETILEIYEKYDRLWYPILEKISIGDGNLYLLSTPILLTNYALKDRRIFELTSDALRPIRGKHILWDEKNKLSQYEAERNNLTNQNTRRGTSPLTILLKHRELRAAWYILIGLTLLYLLLQSKRKQRIIPVMKEKRNTALSFARSIGKLHFKNSNDRKLCLTRMQHFLYYLREKYHFNLKPTDKEFIEQLALLLEVPEETITSVVREYELIYKAGNISSRRALKFCQQLQTLRTQKD